MLLRCLPHIAYHPKGVTYLFLSHIQSDACNIECLHAHLPKPPSPLPTPFCLQKLLAYPILLRCLPHFAYHLQCVTYQYLFQHIH